MKRVLCILAVLLLLEVGQAVAAVAPMPGVRWGMAPSELVGAGVQAERQVLDYRSGLSTYMAPGGKFFGYDCDVAVYSFLDDKLFSVDVYYNNEKHSVPHDALAARLTRDFGAPTGEERSGKSLVQLWTRGDSAVRSDENRGGYGPHVQVYSVALARELRERDSLPKVMDNEPSKGYWEFAWGALRPSLEAGGLVFATTPEALARDEEYARFEVLYDKKKGMGNYKVSNKVFDFFGLPCELRVFFWRERVVGLEGAAKQLVTSDEFDRLVERVAAYHGKDYRDYRNSSGQHTVVWESDSHLVMLSRLEGEVGITVRSILLCGEIEGYVKNYP